MTRFFWSLYMSRMAIHSIEAFAPISVQQSTHFITRMFSTSEGVKKVEWITCSSTKELIRAVNHLVRPGDVVAELGSQLQDVSNAICERSKYAVLVDLERKALSDNSSRERAERRNDNVRKFEERSASCRGIASLSDWRKTLFFHSIDERPKYDVLVLDVSAMVGNDLPWTFISIIREFQSMNEAFGGSCRTILIKSTTLDRLASRLTDGKIWIERGVRTMPVSLIVGTVGVTQYRETLKRAVKPGDAVLEVGCHLGTSTAIVNDKASADGSGGYCIGVDVGPSIVEGAKKRHAHVYFSVGDAWKTADLLRIQQGYLALNPQSNVRLGFDVVYVDVGGLSGPDGLIEALTLIEALENALEPRCLVIKSTCIQQLCTTMKSFWDTTSAIMD
jgi:hypothetical protein